MFKNYSLTYHLITHEFSVASRQNTDDALMPSLKSASWARVEAVARQVAQQMECVRASGSRETNVVSCSGESALQQ